MKNVFEPTVTEELIERTHKLRPDSQPHWGEMGIAQMLAHCNVIYELVYDNTHKKPNPLMRFVLKTFVKKAVVSETPYKPNGQTAPAFLVKDEKDFELEKQRLISYLVKTQQLGEAHFDKKEAHYFGPLSKTEWNNMFYKHLDHHLKQFGV